MQLTACCSIIIIWYYSFSLGMDSYKLLVICFWKIEYENIMLRMWIVLSPFFVLVPSLYMFIGGAISYNSERIKEKTYLIDQCRITATSNCYRTTWVRKTSKFLPRYVVCSRTNWQKHLSSSVFLSFDSPFFRFRNIWMSYILIKSEVKQ